MDLPRVFADFHNADGEGRLRLSCVGTLRDLAVQGVRLRDGLALQLYSEDLETPGRAKYSSEEGQWVAVIDWKAISRKTT